MNADFAAYLRRRRRELDLTRNELGRLVGCSSDTIKKIETGERRPSKQLAALLAEHLQIAPDRVEGFVAGARRHLSEVQPPPLGNLPAPLTSFVGRRRETGQIVRAMLEEKARLVTLLGPPGVGKSRLALHAARQMAAHFADGVWYLQVAALQNPEELLPALAQLFRMPDGAQPAAWLADSLRARRLLLVLDGFDAILAAAGALADLLTACAAVHALVTGGGPLRVYGEQRLPVAPLPLPAPAEWTAPARLGQVAAVQLFVARVRAHDNDFCLTAANAPAVAELCTRLEGIPLAIELAAGRADAATPQKLLAGIAESGRLALTADQYDHTPQRHTLRDIINSSVDRLAPAEQALFAALGIFQGTFDLEAASAVVDGDGERQVTLGQRLDELATRNLIQQVAEGPCPHYRLLDTLREVAVERLETAGAAAVRRRHAHFFARQVQAVDPARNMGNFLTWRLQLRHVYADLLAALHFFLHDADGEDTMDAVLQLAAGLGRFWYLEGAWSLGVRRLGETLTRPGGSPAWRARAAAELGILYSALGRYAAAEATLAEALRLARGVNDLYAQAWTLSQLVYVLLLHGQTARAQTLAQERLQICRHLEDDGYLAIALEQMGVAAVEEGDYARGIAWLQECLALWEGLHSAGGCGTVHCVLGMAALAQGRPHDALAHFQAAHSHFEVAAQAHGLAWVQRNLGLAHIALGQWEAARRALGEAWARYQAMQSADGPIIVVEAVAAYAAALGQGTLAAQLTASAAAQRTAAHLPLTENSRQIYAQLIGPTGEGSPAAPSPLPWSMALEHASALLSTDSAMPG